MYIKLNEKKGGDFFFIIKTKQKRERRITNEKENVCVIRNKP
jgi:hypothetical protein